MSAESDSDLIETSISSELVFDGILLKVKKDQVSLANGVHVVREWIAHPGAAVVIAVLDNGNLLFERQFRYPLGRVFLELPAGKIDSGEHPLATAKRELTEETGYQAEQWQHLGTLHPCIGYSNERIEIFLAKGLSFIGSSLDENEFLTLQEISLDNAISLIRNHEITDAKTISALFWAEKVITQQWSNE